MKKRSFRLAAVAAATTTALSVAAPAMAMVHHSYTDAAGDTKVSAGTPPRWAKAPTDIRHYGWTVRRNPKRLNVTWHLRNFRLPARGSVLKYEATLRTSQGSTPVLGVYIYSSGKVYTWVEYPNGKVDNKIATSYSTRNNWVTIHLPAATAVPHLSYYHPVRRLWAIAERDNAAGQPLWERYDVTRGH